MIIISLIILIIFLSLYCIISSRRLLELSDDQLPSEVEDEQSKSHSKSFAMTSIFDGTIVTANELVDLSEDDVFTRAFNE